MLKINIRSFKQKLRWYKKSFVQFLKKFEKNNIKIKHKVLMEIDAEIWKETDCLSCANCCKKMTPTYTSSDIKRIAKHLNMLEIDFKNKWLKYNSKDKEYTNKSLPCQFLLPNNKCSIYEVRPNDCAGFPHFTKKRLPLYLHVHKQNLDYCPATYNFVERLKITVEQQLK